MSQTYELIPARGASVTRPRVSVVIRCYKQAEYLPEALNSIFIQNFLDWETIIVDDGSPDDTAERALEVIQRNPTHRIHLLRKSNGGLVDALNAGISAAAGIFILQLDADDMLAPQAISKLVQCAETYPGQCVAYGSYQLFGQEQGTIVSVDHYNPSRFLRANVLAYSSLYPRSLWQKVGGYNENMREGFEDWDFWLSCHQHGIPFVGIRDVVLHYRTKASSALKNANAKHDRLVAQMICNHAALYPPSDVIRCREILRNRVVPKIEIPFRKPGATKRSLALIAQGNNLLGGTETLAYDLAQAMAETENSIKLIYCCPQDSAYISDPPALSMPNLEVLFLSDQSPKDIWAALCLNNLDAILAVSDATNPILNVVALAPIKSARKIAYINMNNQMYGQLQNNPIGTQAITRTLSFFDKLAVFYEAGEMAQFLREQKLAYATIPNGVPPLSADAVNIRQRLGIPADLPLLVYPGLIAPLKNQLQLLEVLEHLQTPAAMVFCGDVYPGTPDYANRFFEKLKTSKRCYYTGSLPRIGVAWALQEASLCVFPSLSEGAPLTLMEAMSHGLPWITTPQVKYAYELKGGIIADVEHFPQAMDQLLSHKAMYQRLSLDGRQAFLERFSIRRTASNVLGLL